ncbi:TonB family protein [Stakelama saccharophila]|uniref:TonB family protein n=1 Tax=Stakelama saccharophila TaxID=3075605 RepID=A0ABZ0BC22_9SPHN|nr:TonB family protein [Stakelama sp. W311]WNO54981.1 TonB family protein [Stakelama sp. W311]
MAIALALLASSLFQQPPAAPVAPGRAGQRLITYTSGAVRCGGEGVTPLWREPVVPNGAFIRGRSDDALSPRRLSFRISRTGRPLGIAEADDRSRRNSHTDVAASLAAWRFEPGQARGDCTVTFVPQAYAPDAAPRGEAMRYAALPNIGGPGLNVWPSFAPEESNCNDERPARRVTVYPDFKDVEQEPGRLSTSFFTFDTTADGKPRNVALIGSDGNRELNEAGLQAMRKWRFVSGKAYHGCRYFFWRGGTPAVPAPEMPSGARFSAADTCVAEGEWDHLPSLAQHYPNAFRRRGIEGWAIIRFDVAPWGDTGDVEVLASEPADAFGDAAREIIAQGRLGKSDVNRVGCVERVRFAMPAGLANVQAERD